MLLLALIGILATLLVFWVKYIYSYWDRVGIANIKPTIPFGNLEPVIKRQRSFGFTIYDIYKSTTEPFIGIYLFFRPAILIRDPSLIKKILVSDFSSFHDRGIYCNEKKDPFSGSLFTLPAAKWKLLRNKLSPTFASGRLKGMFDIILNVGKLTEKYLETLAATNEIVDMKNISSRYALDIIANVIFGLDISTLKDENHEFFLTNKRLVNLSPIQSIRATCVFLCPRILSFFGITGFSKTVRNFMIDNVETTIKHRETNNLIRKDIIQLIIQLRNNGKLVDDDNWEIKSNANLKLKSLTIEECAGQIFVFYIAGSETTASTISFCLYELARNRDHLKTLQHEIDDVLLQNNGKITYESLKDLTFLDLCVKETLRKYPVLSILNRECTKDYYVPEKQFTIKKGTPIVITLYGLHRNPTIFKNPDQFNPYRFADGKREFNENCYMPFGDGPHICVGVRLALNIIKIGLISILSKLNFECVDDKELEFEVGTVPIVAKGGIQLKVSVR